MRQLVNNEINSFFPMLNIFYFYFHTSLCMCSVPSIVLFCSSVIPCVRGLLLRDFLNNFDVILIIIVIFIIIIIIKSLIQSFSKDRVVGNYLYKYSPKIRINKYLSLPS